MAEDTQSEREQAARVLDILADCLQHITSTETLNALDTAIACLRSPGASPKTDGKAGGWVRTSERVPDGDEHDEILGLYKGSNYHLYDIVQIGWLRLHPEMYEYWTYLPKSRR